eukprot:g63786.t1
MQTQLALPRDRPSRSVLISPAEGRGLICTQCRVNNVEASFLVLLILPPRMLACPRQPCQRLLQLRHSAPWRSGSRNLLRRGVSHVPGADELPLPKPLPLGLQHMAAAYHPQEVEVGWDEWWESQGYYRPRSDKAWRGPFDLAARSDDAAAFSMVLPPPNVTGTLHLGHALTSAIQDALARFHRMCGKDVCWVPGLDHAGIATQVVVEKHLAKTTGQTRHDLGREAFLQEVWKWKQSHGGIINQQQRRLAVSTDWSRFAFTMDPPRSQAVLEAFVRLHEQGLIFRASRLINWCCHLRTVISDIEVEYEELTGPTKLSLPARKHPVEFGVLHALAYPVEDSTEEVVVATTRIETMFGDTAVAVHPDDPRYQHLIGKQLVQPLTGRHVPVVADAVLVDPTLGTGAVKVTPAHDWKDHECGKRHGLPSIHLLQDDGILQGPAGQFAGMDRLEARPHIITALKDAGCYRGSKPHAMALARCSRSGDVLEPLVKPQWFLDCEQMARQAKQVVDTGAMDLMPAQHKHTWNTYMESSQTGQWCISRQLWWGHRIPAYQVQLSSGAMAQGKPGQGEWVVGRSEAEAREAARVKYWLGREDFALQQDPDVLDTWFSSGIFPLTVWGWPEKTQDLQRFYPLSVMETGVDILFFWVARMQMLCHALYPSHPVPFPKVLLHPLVRDAQGRKMSKSLGNVVDPLELIDGTHESLVASSSPKGGKGGKGGSPLPSAAIGADGLRLALLLYLQHSTSHLNLDLGRVIKARHLGNKVWQAARFVLNVVEQLPAKSEPANPQTAQGSSGLVQPAGLTIWERWVLARLLKTVGEVHQAFQDNQPGHAAAKLQSFFLEDFCDVFIEFSKESTGLSAPCARKQTATNILYTCMEAFLRMAHPILPFLSEELWQRLRGHAACSLLQYPSSSAFPHSIMVSCYPLVEHFPDWLRDSPADDASRKQQACHHFLTF